MRYFIITQEKIGVELGHSIGPFVLEQPLLVAVDVIRHHLPNYKAEVCYHEGEPSRHLVVVKACSKDGTSGFYVLRFDATLQLLVAISYFPPLRVRLAATAIAGDVSGPTLPSTIGDLISHFKHPTYFEATLVGKEEAVRCFYAGTCFVFRCKHGGRDLKLDDERGASKSELLVLHVTTHASVSAHSLWGGHVSLSKLLPTRFDLLEARLVVEAATKSARGVEMRGKSGEALRVLFGATPQDVLQTLGYPDSVWYREDRHVRIDGYPLQGTGAAGVYFSYRRLGVSLLIDTKPHQVKKIVLHTNVPGYFEFCSYSRCHFKASLSAGGLAVDEEDSFLLMPETKWSVVARNVDAACIRHLARCRYEPSTNTHYPFQHTSLWGLFDQFLVETTSHDDIAKVTITAPVLTIATSRRSVVMRGNGSSLLPVREEAMPGNSPEAMPGNSPGAMPSNSLGVMPGNSPGHDQIGKGLHNAQGLDHVEGHTSVGTNERDTSVGTNEGHTSVGTNEGHTSTGSGDDNDLFCSAESSLEALIPSPCSTTPAPLPSQGQFCRSYFCPCLNTVLTEVQEEGPKVASDHHDCIVYEFLDGSRVGGVGGTSIVLTSLDSISCGVKKGCEVGDAPSVLQKERSPIESEEEHVTTDLPSVMSPEHSLFEIVLDKELLASQLASQTASGPTLPGPGGHTPEEGYTSEEGHAFGEGHASKEGHTSEEGHAFGEGHASKEGYTSEEGHTSGEGHTSEEGHASDEGPQTPPPKGEGKILYQPPITTATPSRLLCLSQDLGMVLGRGGLARSTGMASSGSHDPSSGTQSEKAWRRLLGHTQSSGKRVRQKYQPGSRKQGEGPQDAADHGDGGKCEGAVCEEGEAGNSPNPCLEEGYVVHGGTNKPSDATDLDSSRVGILLEDGACPPGGSGDQVVPCGYQLTSDASQTRVHPVALGPQASAVPVDHSAEDGPLPIRGRCCNLVCACIDTRSYVGTIWQWESDG